MKNSLKEDQIPLTNDSSPRGAIIQETRSRFDMLLRDALSKRKGDKRKKIRSRRKEEIELEERHNQELLESKASIVNEGYNDDDDHSNESSQKRQEGKDAVISQTHSLSAKSFTRRVKLSSTSDDDVIHSLPVNPSARTLLPKLKTRRKPNARSEGDSINPGETLKTRDESNETRSPYKSPLKDITKDNEVDVTPEKHVPLRRLSYVIHKFGDSSGDPSPSELSPTRKPARPVPTPRKREQHSPANAGDLSPSPVHDDSTRKVIAEQRELAPPVYSKTSASYENLEKDGGSPPPKPRRKRKDKQKKETRVEIEMESFAAKLSGPVASYEEITPIRRTSKPRETEITKLKSETKATSPNVQTSTEPASKETSNLTYEQIIGITVHKCDYLRLSPLIQHPLVKVYIVDSTTGEHLKKSDSARSVSYFDEKANVDYISPLMTREYNFHDRRSIVPCWEELMVFNEDINCILSTEKPVIILFEILDFVSFSVANAQYTKLGPDGGWHRIAWAFLKPVGSNGELNTGHVCRLQLFKPPPARRKPPTAATAGGCDVFAWYLGGERRKYPATLYVTVRPVAPPLDLPRVMRSRLAMQGEHVGSREGSSEEEEEVGTTQAGAAAKRAVEPVKWSRLPSQSCKVPNRRALVLQTAAKGCFTLKFSNSGLHLACATLSTDEYTIIVYSIPSGKLLSRLSGHQGLVYDLHWSSNDRLLLSASADCTACIWDLTSRKQSRLLQMLPHPGFVYCARFSPVCDSLVVTGCSDHVIRVWAKTKDSFELQEELEEHAGYVTAMCFDKSGLLISGDSVGKILVWPALDQCNAVTPRDLKVRELQDVIINCMVVHPGGQRLLVHARDSLLRMIDLATGSVIQWFHGGLNHWVQTYACLSPCGGLAFAASEDGTVNAWHADTGEQVAVYAGLQFANGASGVDYHPREHMVAFSSAGCAGVIVCVHYKTANGSDVGLQILTKQEIAGGLGGSNGGQDSIQQSRKSSLKETLRVPSVNGYYSEDGRSISGLSQHSNSFLTSTRITRSPDRAHADANGLKLVSIIERMDQVLSSAAPSRCTSESSSPHKPDVSVQIEEDVREDVAVALSPRSRRRLIQSQRQTPLRGE